MLKSSIFEIHLTNSRSFKRRNVVRNVHLFTGSNTLKYARVSLRVETGCLENRRTKIEKIIREVRIEMGKMVDEVVPEVVVARNASY